MQRVNCLLIGDASDGPAGELVRVESRDATLRLFGAYVYESLALASGSTGYTLQNPPWGFDVTPMKYTADGQLVEQRLYDFRVSGSVLTWSPPGDTITGPILFRVLVDPTSGSLVRGILDTVRAGADLSVVRLGGVHATASASGVFFSAVYAGARYNGTTIAISGGATVTVTPAPGTGRIRTYLPRSDADLSTLLGNEFARGTGPVLLDSGGSQNTFTLPNGTWALTGGTDGVLTPALLQEHLETADLAGIELICPVGLTTDALSGAAAVLPTLDYPTLLVAQSPVLGAAITGTANSSRYLVSVGFNVLTEAGTARERTEPAAPLVAALLSRDAFSRTLAPLPEFPPSPLYDAAGLAAGAASGHTLAYRSISHGWALWQVNTGDADWPVSTFRAFQEIARTLYETLEPVLGNTLLDLTTLNGILQQGFTRVRGSRVTDWNLSAHGDTLYASVAFQPFGEIRVIQAQLALGSAATSGPQ